VKKPNPFNKMVSLSLLTAFLAACGSATVKTETGVDIPDVPRAVRPTSPVCTVAAAAARPAVRTRLDNTLVTLAQLQSRDGIRATGVSGAGLPDTIQSMLYTSKALLNNLYFGYSTVNIAELHKQVETKFRAGRTKNLGEYGLTATDDPAIDKPMNEYLNGFKDDHTFYLEPRNFGARQAVTDGATEPAPRFGFDPVYFDDKGVPLLAKGILVTDVQAKSPALNAGLRRGDVLLSLDGQAFSAQATAQATFEGYEKILDDAAKKQNVAMVYSRAGTVKTVPITAIALSAAATPWGEIINGNLFYLRIPTFLSGGTANEVHALVGKANAAGAKGVIVDLRNNGGGALIEMVGAIAAFSPVNASQKIELIDANDVLYQYAAGKVSYADACKSDTGSLAIATPNEWTGNIVVLETKSSASASEYFAQILRLGGKTKVIGEETAGVGNTSTYTIPITSGRALSITTGRAINSKGKPLDATVKPDIAQPDDLKELAKGNDLALNAAFQTLK
jgi:carboxyl-terminal processing protease